MDRLSRNQNHVGILLDEVEREKIAERTMRGKAERAKSGRLSRGEGRGLYGYRYNPATGTRETDEYQAAMAMRIFTHYAETHGFSLTSGELNEAGIAAQSGGRWYALTVRRVLSNESYTGRTVYRRTKRVRAHGRRNGNSTNGRGPKTQVVQRPEEEWIEVEGCTPRIIDQAQWLRIQDILTDPERIRRRPNSRYYALRGRARCGLCGSAMVGQTLTSKGTPYRYYRCRHVYDKNTGRSCSARYVRCEAVEDGVWREVKGVLTSPEVVLQELERLVAEAADESEVRRLESALTDLTEREKRLVHLYTLGPFTEGALRTESAGIASQRQVLKRTSRLSEARRPALPTRPGPRATDDHLRRGGGVVG